MAAIIGALRIEVSAAIAKFQSDMGKAAGTLGAFTSKYERMANRITQTGQRLSLAIAAPVLALGVATAKIAGDFESNMNKVQASTQATTDQIKALREQAIAMGADKKLTATANDAAVAMDNLAKNGLNVEQILNGATRATLKLAAATGGNFDSAANVVTDTMQQFGLQAGDMEKVVDRITGALVASKFSFDDYKLAIGQAGGVAGGLGISFEEFNTALAASAGLFASGSDAGTSFKTFLTQLAPETAKEAKLMKDLGLEFFDAQGKMKSLADIAGILDTQLSGLSDEEKTQILTKIFGTDAMRTAIALMKQGKDGVEAIDKQINAVTADEQIDALTKGLNGMVTQAKKSFEGLAIAVADSGFLEWATGAVEAVTNVIDWFAQLPKPVLKWGAIAAAAAAGVVLLVMTLGNVITALIELGPLLKIAGAGWAFMGNMINGCTAAMSGNAAMSARVAMATRTMATAQAGATATTGALTAAFAALGLVMAVFAVGALGVWALYSATMAQTAAGKKLETSTDAASKATDTFAESARTAAMQVGKQREETLKLAAAQKVQAEQAIRTARANLALAKTKLETLRQESVMIDNSWMQNQSVGPMGALTSGNGLQVVNEGQQRSLQKDVKAGEAKIAELEKTVTDAQAIIDAGSLIPVNPPTPKPSGVNLLGGDDPATKADKIGKATKKYGENIADLQRKVGKGLDELTQPDTLVAVNALYQEIDDITKAAQEAGVDVGTFAGQIGGLKTRIEQLKTEGLAKEAAEFGRAVDKSGRAVEEFARGGLAPLDARLQDVDNRYESLRDRIVEQIEENRVLADVNAEAAEAMKKLEAQLVSLDGAHKAATDSAKALYEAEAVLLDLEAAIDNEATREAIRQAKENRGDFGVGSEKADRLAATERDLARQRLESQRRIQELEIQIMQAREIGDTAQLERLEEQKALEEELFAIVNETTAVQIDAAARLKEAYKDFTDSLSEELSNMIMNWKGDMDGLRGIFKELARQLFIKPGTDAIAEGISGWIKGATSGSTGGVGGGIGGGSSAGGLSGLWEGAKQLFSGFFADGGFIPPGQWGIAGEHGPEPVFGGSTGQTVYPNRGQGGDTYNINQVFKSSDPSRFRETTRQSGRRIREALR